MINHFQIKYAIYYYFDLNDMLVYVLLCMCECLYVNFFSHIEMEPLLSDVTNIATRRSKQSYVITLTISQRCRSWC